MMGQKGLCEPGAHWDTLCHHCLYSQAGYRPGITARPRDNLRNTAKVLALLLTWMPTHVLHASKEQAEPVLTFCLLGKNNNLLLVEQIKQVWKERKSFHLQFIHSPSLQRALICSLNIALLFIFPDFQMTFLTFSNESICCLINKAVHSKPNFSGYLAKELLSNIISAVLLLAIYPTEIIVLIYYNTVCNNKAKLWYIHTDEYYTVLNIRQNYKMLRRKKREKLHYTGFGKNFI